MNRSRNPFGDQEPYQVINNLDYWKCKNYVQRSWIE